MADTRTPGPWWADGPDEFGDFNILHPGNSLAVAAVVSNLRTAEEVAANAAYIVEACNNYDTLKTRNACLTALLELALPSVDYHSRMVGTEEGIKALDKLADDIRQALARETGPTPLDEAWGRINALGGTCKDDFDRGADWAISAALSIIEDLGGKDPIFKETGSE